MQPIFFSHVIHAGAFQIDCQYCHTGARRSSAAGMPSVERCMGCHKIVAAQGNPEVQKLHGYWERKEPIPWVRVFKVPEHAKFVHKNHIQAGLPCQTCHGRIEAMEQVAAPVTGQSTHQRSAEPRAGAESRPQPPVNGLVRGMPSRRQRRAARQPHLAAQAPAQARQGKVRRAARVCDLPSLKFSGFNMLFAC